MYADEEDVQLVPSVVLLSFTGALALMLAMQAAIFGSPFALPAAALSAALLLAGWLLRSGWLWSLGIAARVAPFAAPVWIGALLITDSPGDPTVAAVSLSMAGACFWVRHQLRGMLLGPAWSDVSPTTDEPSTPPTAGWIEELPEAA